MPQKYTEEFKRQAVIHFENTSSVEATCLKYNIARSTLYRWIKDYSNIGTEQESFTLADLQNVEDRSHVLVVGDALCDLIAAHDAGCRFCAVLTGVDGKDARTFFENMGADYILEDATELPQILLPKESP